MKPYLSLLFFYGALSCSHSADEGQSDLEPKQGTRSTPDEQETAPTTHEEFISAFDGAVDLSPSVKILEDGTRLTLFKSEAYQGGSGDPGDLKERHLIKKRGYKTKEGLFVGVANGTYENGQLFFRNNFSKNGQPDGLQASWYENGSKKSEQWIKNGQNHGTWTYWHEDGSVMKTEQFD
jgi:antitoxin component YwqK of YwqJK toxin-antitoxin module